MTQSSRFEKMYFLSSADMASSAEIKNGAFSNMSLKFSEGKKGKKNQVIFFFFFFWADRRRLRRRVNSFL